MNILDTILNFITKDIYLYICIIIGLLILCTILTIVITNKRNRKKIKEDFTTADKLENEIEKIDNGEIPNELGNIIKKMQEDMELKPEDVVKKFEDEQEEKAIISYQELVDSVKSGKIEVVDDEESDINYVESLIDNTESEPIMAIENDLDSGVTPEMVKAAIENISKDSVKEEQKKFKNSKFISPIFGVMDDNLEYSNVKKYDKSKDIQKENLTKKEDITNVINNSLNRKENILDIMNTRDYNELTEEIKRQEEFLNALKEFRNNL